MMTKKTKTDMKEWAMKAQEAELRDIYQDLQSDLSEWESGKISSMILHDRIQKLESGPVREIINLHLGLTQEMRIARAIALDLMRESDIPSDILPGILPQVNYYRQALNANEETIQD
jgi:hypothetical protein